MTAAVVGQGAQQSILDVHGVGAHNQFIDRVSAVGAKIVDRWNDLCVSAIYAEIVAR